MITLSVTAINQKPIYAQITPAPEKFSSNNNDVTTNGSHDSDTDNVKPQGITPSERIDDDATEESNEFTDSTESDDFNSGQTITATEKEDFDPSNQLVEAIMDEVNEAFSASGIFGP